MTYKGNLLFAASALWVCVLAIPASAQEGRPKVAVKTFDNPANFSRSTIGDGLTDILTTELQNTGKFDILERTNVDQITKEMDFGGSQYANSSTFAQKGNLLGAQYLLMGKVTNYSYAESVAGQRQKVNLLGPNTIETSYQQRADVRVDFRLIDVATGQTVISQVGQSHKTNVSTVSEMATWYGYIRGGSAISESSSSLIGRATVGAIKDIVHKLNDLSATIRDRGAETMLSASLDSLSKAQGQVVAEEGSGLWIVSGIGRANGLQKGDHLRAVHENLVKDKSGNVVYRKPVDIGAFEVTDISQPDHAEVRFIANGTILPQPNDVVTADMDFARSLRSGSKDGFSSAASKPTALGGAIDQILKRADSYLADRFWSQALDEYNKAAATKAADVRVLQGQATAHYMMGDFLEGDESADKLLQNGGTLTVAVARSHPMGLCRGTLSIQRAKLTFVCESVEGFDITSNSLIAAEVHKIDKPFIANEKIPDWPVVEIRVRDAGGKEKKYQVVPYMYSKEQSATGKNLGSAFPMDDSDVAQMQKQDQSIVTMIHKYVK